MRGMLDETLAEHPDPLEAYQAFARRLVSEPRFIEITRLRTLALSLVHEPVIHEALAPRVRDDARPLDGHPRGGPAARHACAATSSPSTCACSGSASA